MVTGTQVIELSSAAFHSAGQKSAESQTQELGLKPGTLNM